ncbi:MAG: S8 family serine peptidase [Acidobacteriota bacterium]
MLSTRETKRVNQTSKGMGMQRSSRLLLGFALGWLAAVPCQAVETSDGSESELIVLFDHVPPAMEQATIPLKEVLAQLSVGQPTRAAGQEMALPTAARWVVNERASEAARMLHLAEPTSPAAILQRYLVLSYPETADLKAIRESLERNPAVMFVGRNRHYQLSVDPTDPLFPVAGQPHEYQWGSHSLDLPSAWDDSKGHAYVGVIDTGTDVSHPDLRAFDASGVFVGGNFREHLSYDYGYDDSNVDEGEPQIEGGRLRQVARAGHGTHVSGIVGATPNNGVGVAGACWNCSLIVSKVSHLLQVGFDFWNVDITEDDLVAGILGSIERGVGILSMSLGYRPGQDGAPDPDCNTEPLEPICVALSLAEARDVVVVAASGNDATSTIDFPAIDPRVLAAGGIEPDGQFWNDCPGHECGSNYDPEQLVTPAKQVVSTFYRGIPYSPNPSDPPASCDDSGLPGEPGFGPCTGTSMAAPYLAGAAGILRSLNPLLSKSDIEQLLNSSLENPQSWDPSLGRGKPNLGIAVANAIGQVGGSTIENRLTPLFSLYSPVAEDHLYTTFPQWGATEASGPSGYSNVGPDVGGYGRFPGLPCVVGPCEPEPGASVYVFSSDRSPNQHPLVPLYRLSFEGLFPGGPNNPQNRETTYTTEAPGIQAYRNLGYDLDGIEGYVYKRCTPEPSCIPAGAVRLYRLYNANRDDFAIFPESELPQWLADGYAAKAGFSDWIGYVYENVDSDADHLIDGFEVLIGTDPQRADTDCDLKADGIELPLAGLQLAGLDPQSDPLLLVDQVVSSLRTFQSCTALTAGSGFVVTSAGDVTLRAGSEITLNEGFAVNAGGELRAQIDGALVP